MLGWQNYGGVSQLSTFAGKEESSDNGEPAVTAVRETFEELLHLVFEDERRAGDFPLCPSAEADSHCLEAEVTEESCPGFVKKTHKTDRRTP